MHQSHILVVDDEAAIRLTLDALLRRCGHRVTLAASGEQALAYLSPHRVDLVLLDLFLSGISGLEVAKFVRVLQPSTAILMLTGSDVLAEVEQSGYDYMEKTSAPQIVLDRIATLLMIESPTQ
jgi:DNA-binding response OmpR family regulator